MLLSEKAGSYLPNAIKTKLYDLVGKRDDIFKSTEKLFVLSHGDFFHNNMIVNKNEKVFLTNFEYAIV